MGYSLSWVAVHGKSSDELQMTPTGAREEIVESPLVGVALPNGWALLAADHSERFVDEKFLAGVSLGCEVVACFVEEHVMVSHATSWKDGHHLWTVMHDGSEGLDGPRRLVIEGEPPAPFTPIRERLEEEQKKGDADYLFDVPVELAKAVAGFRHDEDVPGASGEIFEVLSEKSGGRGFLKKLFGR